MLHSIIFIISLKKNIIFSNKKGNRKDCLFLYKCPKTTKNGLYKVLTAGGVFMYNKNIRIAKEFFMKKFITALLIIVLIFTIGIIPAFAQSENLLENPTFEYAMDNWDKYASEVEESEESADDDGCSVLVTERTDPHSSIIQDILAIIKYNGSGKYNVSAYAKVKGTGTIKFAPVVRIQYSADSKPTYCVGARKEITGEAWTKVELSLNITGEVSDLVQAKLYFTEESGSATLKDLYIDCVSLTKIDAIVTPKPTPSVTATPVPVKTQIKRPDKLRIGAIRWDAFYKTTGVKTNVSDQVAACLSPSEYHWVAPFFADVTSDNKISFPEYTLEVFEKECDYAIDAGIDYFAYVWYETFNQMSLARKYHAQSEKRNQIQMCAIIESIKDDKTMEELFNTMKEDYYLKIDGMPILYINEGIDYASLRKLRSMAAQAGVEEALYIVYMTAPTPNQSLELPSLGYDAVTMYCVRPDKFEMSYADLIKGVDKINDAAANKFRTKDKTYQYIPLVQFGRYTKTRKDTGVSWVKDYIGWANPATPQELQEHTLNTLKWTHSNADVTEANAVISYAWNEHDEGGWICPTLKVDDKGNLILDANGNKQANTEYLDAVKQAISEFRNYEANNKPTAPAATLSTLTPGVTPTNAVENNPDNSAIVTAIIVTGSAVIVAMAAAVVIVVVVTKKKNNKEQKED